MSTKEKLDEARDILGRLVLKSLDDEDEEKHNLYTVLYNLACAITEMQNDIEIIKEDVREIKHK